MSSIAYVCDEDMVEYHRLSQHNEMLFWRIATKRKFSDFHIGDLLFFYAKTPLSNEKMLLGYGHFTEVKRLSLSQMWKDYGEKTGYFSYQALEQAIQKAARKNVPKKMNCLVLKNVVFFARPISTKEVGLKFSKSLESFAYIDHQQPSATSEILKIAEDEGINLWFNAIDKQTEEIFKIDAIEHKFLSLTRKYPNELSPKVQKEQKLLLKKETEWKTKKDFRYAIPNEKECKIAIPNLKISKYKQRDLQVLIGRWVCILTELKEYYPEINIQFSTINGDEEINKIVKKVFK